MAGVKSTFKSCLLIAAITCLGLVLCGYEEEFDLLIPPRGCESAKCPLQKNYKLRQQLCSYNCSHELKYVCLENGEEEVTEFCAPKLECKPGYKGSFSVDPNNPSKVIMKMEMCPNGTYQPHTSGCIHACKKKLEFSALPERFKGHSLGDNVRPPTVYCDYTSGQHNRKNLTFVDFDDQFKFKFLNLCTNESNPCAEKLTVLPNGSCALPCRKDEARDVSDFFICKHGTGTNRPSSQTVDVIIQTTIGLKIITEEKKNQTTRHTLHPDTDTGTTLIITVIIIVIFLVFIIMALIIWYCLKTRRNQNTSNGDIEEGMPMQNVVHGATDETDQRVDTLDERAPALTMKNISRNGSTKAHTNGHTHNTGEEMNGLLSQTEPQRGCKHLKEKKTSKCVNSKPSGEELKKKYNNTLSQAMMTSLTANMNCVGALMINGVLGGTVFMVGRCYVMTAFHVIRSVVYCDEDGEIHLERLQSDRIYVNFNQAIGDFPQMRSHLSCCYYNPDLDIAILKFCDIRGLPASMYLYKDDISQQGMEDVSVIGYGNPKQPFLKHLDPVCEIVPPNSQKIQSAHAYLERKKDYFKRKIPAYSETVDEGYHGYDSEDVILFDGYMEHGASGGPLLTNDNPASVKVVGVLTHGMPECFFRLPPAVQGNFPKEYRFHKACKMSSVFQALKRDNPDLAKELFGSLS